LFGRYSGELQIGLEDWYKGIHPDDVARVKLQFENFLRGGETDWVDEYRFQRADGSYVYIHDRGRKFYNESGQPARIAGTMIDIPERKQADEVLLESEERYRQLTEFSTDGVVIASSDGTIHMSNPSMLLILGATHERVVGRNLFHFLA